MSTDVASPDLIDEVESPEALHVADRCDRCKAQAFVRVMLGAGSPLLFCGHHFARHEAALLAAGGSVDDFRHLINQKASESSA